MQQFQKTISKNALKVSLLVGVFLIYPNIIYMFWDIGRLSGNALLYYMLFFFYRYFFFSALALILLKQNIAPVENNSFYKRVLRNFKITLIAYLAYVGLSLLMNTHEDCFTGHLLFQFLVTFILFTLLGHVLGLYSEQQEKDKEIESLKFENLKSKCDALTNQIHPHFLFNTLNTLSFLVREDNKKQTLEFVNKLSNIFRYILQSDKNGIVTLKEELEFLKAFSFLMETRFEKKLHFDIRIECDKLGYKLPVLSLLPLLENVVMHNVIDSDHKMKVDIFVNEVNELVVVNPVFPKADPVLSNGTGLANLKSRFTLMMDREVRVENDGDNFSVYLPLKC